MTRERPTSRAVAMVQRHRTWCALWSLEAFCDCGGVEPVDLVEWWAAAARRRPMTDQ